VLAGSRAPRSDVARGVRNRQSVAGPPMCSLKKARVRSQASFAAASS
jgi:hypothetical protein